MALRSPGPTLRWTRTKIHLSSDWWTVVSLWVYRFHQFLKIRFHPFPPAPSPWWAAMGSIGKVGRKTDNIHCWLCSGISSVGLFLPITRGPLDLRTSPSLGIGFRSITFYWPLPHLELFHSCKSSKPLVAYPSVSVQGLSLSTSQCNIWMVVLFWLLLWLC